MSHLNTALAHICNSLIITPLSTKNQINLNSNCRMNIYCLHPNREWNIPPCKGELYSSPLTFLTLSIQAAKHDLQNITATTVKEEGDIKDEQKQNGYSPTGNSPPPVTAGSSSFNDCSDSQSPSSASYHQGCAQRGNDFQVAFEMSNSQIRQFPPIFGAIPADPGSAYAGRSFPGSRESYDSTDSSLPIDSRHGLPNDAYSQGLNWYHAGPPAYI